MAPVHIIPFLPKGIGLVKQMVISLKPAESIRIIYPVHKGIEMILFPYRSIIPFSQFHFITAVRIQESYSPVHQIRSPAQIHLGERDPFTADAVYPLLRKGQLYQTVPVVIHVNLLFLSSGSFQTNPAIPVICFFSKYTDGLIFPVVKFQHPHHLLLSCLCLFFLYGTRSTSTL